MTDTPKRSGWRHRLLNFALLILSLLLALGIAEIAVRATVADQIPIFPRNVDDANYEGYRIRRNKPHSRYFHKSPDGVWKFRINAQGMRANQDYTYAKPAGTLRVLTIGDSFTIGYEVGQNESYPVIIERLLKKQGRNVQVLNAGVSGFGTAEELVYLEHEGLRFQPDIVVMGFYASDLADNVRSGLFALEGDNVVEKSRSYLPAGRIRKILYGLPGWEWLGQHSYLHNYLNQFVTYKVRDIVLERNAAKFAKTGAPVDSTYTRRLAARLVERAAALCAQRGIPFILMDVNDRSDVAERRPGRRTFPLQELKPGVKLTYFDSGEVLEPWRGVAHLYQPHGHGHWTQVGHLAVGQGLARLISEKCVNEGGQGGALCKDQQRAEQQQHNDDGSQPPLLPNP